MPNAALSLDQVARMDALPTRGRAERSVQQLAASVGVGYPTLRSFLCNERGLRACELSKLLDPEHGDMGLLRQWLASIANVAIIPLRKSKRSLRDVLQAYARAEVEHADVCAVVSKAIEDGAITRAEAAKCEKEILEHMAVAAEMLGHIRGLAGQITDGRAKTMKDAEGTK